MCADNRLSNEVSRQSAIAGVHLALHQLTDDVTEALELAKLIQTKLVGARFEENIAPPASTDQAEKPLLAELEERIRMNRGRVSEIRDILAATHHEIS